MRTYGQSSPRVGGNVAVVLHFVLSPLPLAFLPPQELLWHSQFYRHLLLIKTPHLFLFEWIFEIQHKLNVRITLSELLRVQPILLLVDKKALSIFAI